MPDIRLADGSRLFERMRGPRATEIVTTEGPRILIRPDGYIAHIGETQFREYAGAPPQALGISFGGKPLLAFWNRKLILRPLRGI
jgi:hypothetical protein